MLLECPLGTMPEGSQCVPYQAVPDTYEPPEPDGLADFAIAEDLDEPADIQAGVDTQAVELPTTEDTLQPTVGVGSPCVKGADCGEGWACLNWPGGYCSLLDCSATSCPTGSVCTAVSGGNVACLRLCENDSDCPNVAQQACKHALPTLSGQLEKVCFGLSDNAGFVGAECQGPSECQGPALCEAISPNGYCSIAECKETGCPEGSTCARLQGLYFCLRNCDEATDCYQSVTQEQSCVSLKDVDKKPVDVCSPGEGEQGVGDACVSDVECKSATCQILGEGRCSQSDKPCDSESDCDGAEFCNTGPQTKVGYCTGQCSLNAPCAGAGFCALSEDIATGTCRSTCPSGSDPGNCPINDGFSCIYGVPLGEFSGKYLCDFLAPGDVGSSCTADVDCPGGSCTGGEYGVCIRPCSADYGCPFPGTCVKDDEGGTTCRPSCLSASDCQPGEDCAPALGGLTNACVAP